MSNELTKQMIDFIKMVRDEQISHGSHGDTVYISIADGILYQLEQTND